MNDNALHNRIAEASKTLFSYCMARTPNRWEAEDLCQDILCELVKSSARLRDERAFYAFMWSLAGNVYKQWCRKRAGARTCPLPEDVAEIPAAAADDESEEALYLLRRELSLLSEKYRRATVLYYLERKSCAEIACSLGVSESMVKYLLFKSRKKLKEGFEMERKLGMLSYAPKSLVPLYNGEGPNRFWDFMQSRLKQNIVSACYNDALTDEQISLETGVPLAYLDEEIAALVERRILVREGRRCKANVILLTSDCAAEIARGAVETQEKIADAMGDFLETHLQAFREIGFAGADFSDGSLRWQFLTFLLRAVLAVPDGGEMQPPPQTAWGERAYLWLAEPEAVGGYSFSVSQVESRDSDVVFFCDFLPAPKSDHHDFYGNARYIDILCDVAHGRCGGFSAYDREAVAEMVRKGYVRAADGVFTAAMPVFTQAQYDIAAALAQRFAEERLGPLLRCVSQTVERVLREHTPAHLQGQVPAIADANRFLYAFCAPAQLLVERRILSADWKATEMPTVSVMLNE